MDHHSLVTIALIRCMAQNICSNIQGNSWASCLWCSFRWYWGLWGDPPLSDVVRALHSTHKTVEQYIHTCTIVVGPLIHWWGPRFKILDLNTRLTAEHVQGVVGGDDVVSGVVHPCHMMSVPHITLIKQLDSISIHVSSSLDHYNTDELHSSSSWVHKTRVTAENVWSIVWGHIVVCGVIHPCRTWSIPHIAPIKQWDRISIHLSKFFDNYPTDWGTWFQLFVPRNRVTTADHV